jgi:hypothetical protein
MPLHIRPQSTVDQGLFLSDLDILDREIAEMCGVAVTTVRRRRRLYQRRGVVRTANGAPCPDCHGRVLDARSYSLLLGAYLGDGHIIQNKRGVYLLSLFQDARYAGLIQEWRTAVELVKGARGSHMSSKPGCTAIQSYWMHWPCLFPQHGPGRKHERSITLEPWQKEIIEADPRPFLRGLFHSDGCRITNWTVRQLTTGPKRLRVPPILLQQRVRGHPRHLRVGAGPARSCLAETEMRHHLRRAARSGRHARRVHRPEVLNVGLRVSDERAGSRVPRPETHSRSRDCGRRPASSTAPLLHRDGNQPRSRRSSPSGPLRP